MLTKFQLGQLKEVRVRRVNQLMHTSYAHVILTNEESKSREFGRLSILNDATSFNPCFRAARLIEIPAKGLIKSKMNVRGKEKLKRILKDSIFTQLVQEHLPIMKRC